MKYYRIYWQWQDKWSGIIEGKGPEFPATLLKRAEVIMEEAIKEHGPGTHWIEEVKDED